MRVLAQLRRENMALAMHDEQEFICPLVTHKAWLYTFEPETIIQRPVGIIYGRCNW